MMGVVGGDDDDDEPAPAPAPVPVVVVVGWARDRNSNELESTLMTKACSSPVVAAVVVNAAGASTTVPADDK